MTELGINLASAYVCFGAGVWFAIIVGNIRRRRARRDVVIAHRIWPEIRDAFGLPDRVRSARIDFKAGDAVTITVEIAAEIEAVRRMVTVLKQYEIREKGEVQS